MFRIGEFSQIAQVSDYLLRHYDDIGLLKPSHVDEWTGYRYYNASQLPRLNRILALKDLGLSLDEARQVLADDISSSEIRNMLTVQKSQIEELIQSEKLRLQRVDARLRQIEDNGSLQDLEIITKSIPAQPFLAMDYTIHLLEDGPNVVRTVTQKVEAAFPAKQIKHFAAIFHYDGFKAENVDVEVGFVLTKATEVQIPISHTDILALRQLPGVEKVVSLVQYEENHILFHAYEALGRWIELNRFQLAGPARKLYLTTPDANNEDKALVEIQFPIHATDSLSSIGEKG